MGGAKKKKKKNRIENNVDQIWEISNNCKIKCDWNF